MKAIHKTLTIALCLAFSLGFMMASGLSVQKAYADDYKYKIRVYSGKEGYFGDSSNHVREVEVEYGDEVKVVTDDGIYVNGSKEADLTTTLLDDETYYLKGVRESGHDNKEYLRSTTFDASGDMSFSSVYGIAGGMVKYVVNYVGADGSALADSGEYYGMVGDKPVVSFLHIEGYVPQAYNLGKTLTSNEADNVFTFTYTRGESGTTVVTVDGGTTGGTGGAAGAGAGTAGTNIADNETPTAGPADYVDLDDNQTPTTDGSNVNGSKDIGSKGIPKALPIAIGGAAVLLGIGFATGAINAVVAGAAAALSSVKRKEDDE